MKKAKVDAALAEDEKKYDRKPVRISGELQAKLDAIRIEADQKYKEPKGRKTLAVLVTMLFISVAAAIGYLAFVNIPKIIGKIDIAALFPNLGGDKTSESEIEEKHVKLKLDEIIASLHFTSYDKSDSSKNKVVYGPYIESITKDLYTGSLSAEDKLFITLSKMTREKKTQFKAENVEKNYKDLFNETLETHQDVGTCNGYKYNVDKKEYIKDNTACEMEYRNVLIEKTLYKKEGARYYVDVKAGTVYNGGDQYGCFLYKNISLLDNKNVDTSSTDIIKTCDSKDPTKVIEQGRSEMATYRFIFESEGGWLFEFKGVEQR